MEKTTRRHLLRAAAVGGATAAGLGAIVSGTSSAAAQKPERGNEHAHDNRPLLGNRAHAVVSFGQWEVDPNDTRGPLDRGVPPPPPPNRNVHKHLPFEVEVDAGGAVSFIISGLHQILIYANSELADVQAAANPATDLPEIPLLLPPGPPPVNLPPLVNLATDRVYRGLDPRILYYMSPGPGGALIPNLNVDRVESVNFFEPGRYLVVCGVRPHFNEGMHGYVNVKA
jgi:plastocyanin